jgi:hypothetical protein
MKKVYMKVKMVVNSGVGRIGKVTIKGMVKVWGVLAIFKNFFIS